MVNHNVSEWNFYLCAKSCILILMSWHSSGCSSYAELGSNSCNSESSRNRIQSAMNIQNWRASKKLWVKTKTNMWCFWMFSVFLFFWGNSCIRPNVFDVQLQGNNITKLPISKLDNVNFLFVRDIFLKCQLNCSIWWETLGFLSLFPIVTDWSQKWPLPCAPAVATMKVD